MNDIPLNIIIYSSMNHKLHNLQHIVGMGSSHKLSSLGLPFLFLVHIRTFTPALHLWQQNAPCTYPSVRPLSKMSLTWIKQRADPREYGTPVKAQLIQFSEHISLTCSLSSVCPSSFSLRTESWDWCLLDHHLFLWPSK